MTNAERRAALNEARQRALEFAQLATRMSGDRMPSDSGIARAASLARTWADVAEAMKDGDPVHDAPDGKPITILDSSPEYLTR